MRVNGLEYYPLIFGYGYSLPDQNESVIEKYRSLKYKLGFATLAFYLLALAMIKLYLPQQATHLSRIPIFLTAAAYFTANHLITRHYFRKYEPIPSKRGFFEAAKIEAQTHISIAVDIMRVVIFSLGFYLLFTEMLLTETDYLNTALDALFLLICFFGLCFNLSYIYYKYINKASKT